MRKRHFLDHSIPPYPTGVLAEPERFRHRAGGARTYGPSCVERQNEVRCVRQRLLEHCGDAIGGDHIKPHARADYDSRGLGILVAALRRDKNFDFAGYIEIVGSSPEAGVNHWCAGSGEWASAIRDDRDIRERCRRRRYVRKIKDLGG
jgi:hypothetical protein